MVWRIEDPQGNEAGKVRYDVVPYTRGVVLDLGCGPYKAFPHFIGVDNGHHDAAFGWTSKPDIAVQSCERLEGDLSPALARKLGMPDVPSEEETEAIAGAAKDEALWNGRVPDGCCDAVFSSHLLEHIVDTDAALAEWWRVIKNDGYLVLYLPHRDFYPNVGHEGANPDHKHDFVPSDIMEAMLRVAPGWELVVSETRDLDTEYSFLQVYRKRADAVQDIERWSIDEAARRGRKNACVVRYGGIGDMIMASSLFPALKARGYHVTVMTTPSGAEIIAHDPNVDEILLQDKDQVPNGALAEHLFVWAKKFDKFVNLCESVEANLLPLPGSTRHAWPDSVRQKYLNENYIEFTHELAELPFEPRPRFFASADELARVRKWREGIGSAYVVLWCLAGSSVHKSYPHMDAVVAQLLIKRPDIRIVFVGDDVCRILEQQWEGEPRAIRLSGRIGVRETLALACHGVDCVVGPETGVLNAVSHLKVPKVIMLSHSSIKNLTRNWANTVSLVPAAAEAPCYPCHRMHFERTFCPTKKIPLEELRDAIAVMDEGDRALMEQGIANGKFDTLAAVCAYGIPPERVTNAILSMQPKRIAVPA